MEREHAHVFARISVCESVCVRLRSSHGRRASPNERATCCASVVRGSMHVGSAHPVWRMQRCEL
eukprot:5981748-Pleurochrysis_carterae.AAC.2